MRTGVAKVVTHNMVTHGVGLLWGLGEPALEFQE